MGSSLDHTIAADGGDRPAADRRGAGCCRRWRGHGWRIEKAFRTCKHDLQARPIYHHLRESIEAHLSIVAAMGVSHYIEHQTGWSIKKFVRTARRYRTVKIKAATLP